MTQERESEAQTRYENFDNIFDQKDDEILKNQIFQISRSLLSGGFYRSHGCFSTA